MTTHVRSIIFMHSCNLYSGSFVFHVGSTTNTCPLFRPPKISIQHLNSTLMCPAIKTASLLRLLLVGAEIGLVCGTLSSVTTAICHFD